MGCGSGCLRFRGHGLREHGCVGVLPMMLPSAGATSAAILALSWSPEVIARILEPAGQPLPSPASTAGDDHQSAGRHRLDLRRPRWPRHLQSSMALAAAPPLRAARRCSRLSLRVWAEVGILSLPARVLAQSRRSSWACSRAAPRRCGASAAASCRRVRPAVPASPLSAAASDRPLVLSSAASRRFIWSVVTAQVLVQIGAFSLPALLPDYIDRWHLTKTEAGAVVGIFFAAYVAAVPVLVSLTDRIPTRRVYAVGAGLTALSHFGFAFVADGFWSALSFAHWPASAGRRHMPGSRRLPARSTAMSGRAVSVCRRRRRRRRAPHAVPACSANFPPSAAFLFGSLAQRGACDCLDRDTAAAPKARQAIRALLDFRRPPQSPRMAWIRAPVTPGRWRRCAPGVSRF